MKWKHRKVIDEKFLNDSHNLTAFFSIFTDPDVNFIFFYNIPIVTMDDNTKFNFLLRCGMELYYYSLYMEFVDYRWGFPRSIFIFGTQRSTKGDCIFPYAELVFYNSNIKSYYIKRIRLYFYTPLSHI